MNRSSAVFTLALAAALCACATTNKEPPPKPFTGTRWEVVLEMPIAGEQPTLRFGDGRMEGFGGCNRLAARYVQDAVGARAIAIGRIEAGRHAACAASTQAAEERVLEILQMVSSYTITGDTMTMSGSAGTLHLRAVSEEKKP
jgi:heat shock protein HslJ